MPKDSSRFRRNGLFQAALTGCGFAMAAGWIWFTGLLMLWPSILLETSSPNKGGATLLMGILCLGFPLLGFSMSNKSDLFRRVGPHFLHGAALPFILITLAQSSIPDSPTVALLFSLFAALAVVPPTFFWLAAMFSLAPAVSGLAYFCAAAAAACIAFGASALGPEARGFVLPCLLVAAWALSLIVPVLPDSASPGENTASGSAVVARSTPAPGRPIPAVPLFLIPAFFFLGFVDGLSPYAGTEPAPAIFCIYGVLGVLFVLTLRALLRRIRAWTVLSLAFLLHAAGSLAGVPASVLQAVESILTVTMIISISIFFSHRNDWAIRSAVTGITAGLIALMINAGFALGEGLAPYISNPVLLAAGGVLAAGVQALCRNQFGSQFRAMPAPPAAAETPLAAEDRKGFPEKKAWPDIPGDLNPLFSEWNLTPKEKNVAALIRAGLSNPDIGKSMGVSENTVRTHLKSLYRKSGAIKRNTLESMLLTGTGLSNASTLAPRLSKREVTAEKDGKSSRDSKETFTAAAINTPRP